jgi:hypothetical protein
MIYTDKFDSFLLSMRIAEQLNRIEDNKLAGWCVLLNLWWLWRLLPLVADVQLSVATVDQQDRTVVVRQHLYIVLVMQSLSRMLRVCDAIKAAIFKKKSMREKFVWQQQQHHQQQQQINQFFFFFFSM